MTKIKEKKINAGNLNINKGCTCQFMVKCLTVTPSVALITYNVDKHVDKKGL